MLRLAINRYMTFHVFVLLDELYNINEFDHLSGPKIRSEIGETAVCLVWGLCQILFVPSVGYGLVLNFYVRLCFLNQIARFGASTFCHDRMDFAHY